jgi:hypothetical protein
MTSPTTPISAAAKQQHQYQDKKDQIHRMSPIGFAKGNRLEGTKFRKIPPLRRAFSCADVHALRLAFML